MHISEDIVIVLSLAVLLMRKQSLEEKFIFACTQDGSNFELISPSDRAFRCKNIQIFSLAFDDMEI